MRSANGTVKISLTLEHPKLVLSTSKSITIKKEESVNITVLPEYCPLVVSDYDPGVVLQWEVSSPNDTRTADQLLSISTDGTTATVRPYSLTPGYKYTVETSLHYTADVGLSASVQCAISVETEKLNVRIQVVPYPSQTDDLEPNSPMALR